MIYSPLACFCLPAHVTRLLNESLFEYKRIKEVFLAFLLPLWMILLRLIIIKFMEDVPFLASRITCEGIKMDYPKARSVHSHNASGVVKRK